jgi:sugar fermentation stimulation protein A
MQFNPPLIRATLLRRYKRFLADMRLPDGTEITAHCPNPGAMMGLAQPGAEVWIQPATNPKRKLRYTWRLERLGNGGFAGIDTGVPNVIVKEALLAQRLQPFVAYTEIRPEQKYGTNSRIDFLLSGGGQAECYLEVKNVHLERTPGLAEFPDSVTARGAKHLRELAAVAQSGARAVMLYVVQMDGPTRLSLAKDIDPAYAAAAQDARAAGVDMMAFGTEITCDSITLSNPIPVEF